MAKVKKFIGCTIKNLPSEQAVEAATVACQHNPANAPAAEASGLVLPPAHLAALTGKLWPASGVKLAVAFMDSPTKACRRKILEAINRWKTVGKANVSFVETAGVNSADVRLARTEGEGYWSFLGTNIRMVDRNSPTMNLDSFTEKTSDAEYLRVPVHEAGHTLGFPHEHLRGELVKKIDPKKALLYFQRWQGWDEETVRSNVLTPLEESSIRGTAHTDMTSVMCYFLTGEITFDGQPITGGVDLSASDIEFVQQLYPPAVRPEPEDLLVNIAKAGKYRLTPV